MKQYLDIREINGYSIQYAPFNSASPHQNTNGASDSQTTSAAPQNPGQPQDMTATIQTIHPAPEVEGKLGEGDLPNQINCLVYIGLPTNPQFLGPQDPQALAEHIVRSRGPSGENMEYLYQLETALAGLSRESGDEHISDLARRCRDVEARLREASGGGKREKDALQSDLQVEGAEVKRVMSRDAEEAEETEKA